MANIRINVNNVKDLYVPVGTKIFDIVEQNKDILDNPVIGVKVNNEITRYDEKLYKDSNIELFDYTDLNGYKMYQAGLKFLLEVAIKEICGKNVDICYHHSIKSGMYATISNYKLKEEDILKLKEKMDDFINRDLPFTKINVNSRDAINYYNIVGEVEKGVNIHNIYNQVVDFYKLFKYINYFYVDMPNSTSCLKDYDLIYISGNEIALMFTDKNNKDAKKNYLDYVKVIDTFKIRTSWLKMLNTFYIGDINRLLSKGTINDFVRICELNFDSSIYEICKSIAERKKKYVLISGPSSSGKTTSAKKVCLFLRALGYEPFLISTDDYFKNRADTPKNPDGTYDYEGLDALEIDMFNKHLKALSNNEEVIIPSYNFITGEKEFKNKPTKLSDKGIVVIEGLHSLNDELTKYIDNELKFKIYLSPFIAINIDRHNYISSTDLRLIRRIVRDNNNRGTDASATIEMWQRVRDGEEKNVFPFFNNADVILNTALSYEFGVLKTSAIPLLYDITNDSPYYEEARRLINFLKLFFDIPSEYVSNESIIREFIGGSIFRNEGDK